MNAYRARRIEKHGRMKIETAKHRLARAVVCAVLLAPAGARGDADSVAQASGMLAAMEGDAHRVALLLRDARAARRPEPIHCVDAYLTRIDTDVRYGREALADYRAALARGDTAEAKRALSWLATRREAARSASFAADACVTPTLATDRDQTTVHVVTPTLPPDRAVFGR